MNKIAEDCRRLLESINPTIKYGRLKAELEKDPQFIERLQHAVNQWFIQHGPSSNSSQGGNGGDGN
jgi:hypothetical protein